MRRHSIDVALLAKAGGRARCSEVLHVFRIVEKTQLTLAGAFERSGTIDGRIRIAAHQLRADQLRDFPQ